MDFRCSPRLRENLQSGSRVSLIDYINTLATVKVYKQSEKMKYFFFPLYLSPFYLSYKEQGEKIAVMTREKKGTSDRSEPNETASFSRRGGKGGVEGE